MDDRRVHTEECHDDGLSEDEEFYKRQLEFYMDSDDEYEYEDDDLHTGDNPEHNMDGTTKVVGSDDPQANPDDYTQQEMLMNYKGIYIDDEPGEKFQDPETGAHFDYKEIYDRLLEVEKEIGGSQERDQKTIKMNQELLKIDEEDEEFNQNQLFRTEDNTLQKPRLAQTKGKKMNEVMSIGSDKTGQSCESKRIKSSFGHNDDIRGLINMKKFQKKSHDFGNLKSKSLKKNLPKKSSELIFLKKKNVSKPAKVHNINLFIGGKERDSKSIYKNNKAKSKYQKYLYKNEKTQKLAYQRMSAHKPSKGSIGQQKTYDKRIYEIIQTGKLSGFHETERTRTRSGKRKASKSNTSRKGMKVIQKKSFFRFDGPSIDGPFATAKHKRHFQSFNQVPIKFPKQTPKSKKNDKLYSIKACDKGSPNLIVRDPSDRRYFESISSTSKKHGIINLHKKGFTSQDTKHHHRMPGSTKSMQMNLGTKPITKVKSKHKKSCKKKSQHYVKKTNPVYLSTNDNDLEEFSSPYKLKSKTRDFLLKNAKISAKEYSNYLKSQNALNSIFGNSSIESSNMKRKPKSKKFTQSMVSQLQALKPSTSSKMELTTKISQPGRKKKARSKAKNDKNIVFMVPGKQMGQYISIRKKCSKILN
ncbi:unnamed protein product [Moneuplotes crassus]|uniref:Uncharacterized protein n=1 Tax=Euplotes crassus TaxID=5936 RepID=A0AAD2DAS4_EUPCR|nr:unnamed protein product [Moneuplotes crassus]